MDKKEFRVYIVSSENAKLTERTIDILNIFMENDFKILINGHVRVPNIFILERINRADYNNVELFYYSNQGRYTYCRDMWKIHELNGHSNYGYEIDPVSHCDILFAILGDSDKYIGKVIGEAIHKFNKPVDVIFAKPNIFGSGALLIGKDWTAENRRSWFRDNSDLLKYIDIRSRIEVPTLLCTHTGREIDLMEEVPATDE